MPKLSQVQRERAAGIVQAGKQARKVARVLGIHHSTVPSYKGHLQDMW